MGNSYMGILSNGLQCTSGLWCRRRKEMKKVSGFISDTGWISPGIWTGFSTEKHFTEPWSICESTNDFCSSY